METTKWNPSMIIPNVICMTEVEHNPSLQIKFILTSNGLIININDYNDGRSHEYFEDLHNNFQTQVDKGDIKSFTEKHLGFDHTYTIQLK